MVQPANSAIYAKIHDADADGKSRNQAKPLSARYCAGYLGQDHEAAASVTFVWRTVTSLI